MKQSPVAGQRSPLLSSASRRFVPLLVLVVAVVLFMGAGDDLQTRFNDLGHRMMCRCGCNQVLLECNHVGCTYSDKMRGELAAGLQKGDNDNLILQSFVQEYGDVVLAAPTTTGFNRVAWVMPFVALGLGLLAVVLVVRAWRGRLQPAVAGAAGSLPPEAVDAYRRRAREETDL
jgi:cytochrome c-type biogenesis protein CcmH